MQPARLSWAIIPEACAWLQARTPHRAVLVQEFRKGLQTALDMLDAPGTGTSREARCAEARTELQAAISAQRQLLNVLPAGHSVQLRAAKVLSMQHNAGLPWDELQQAHQAMLVQQCSGPDDLAPATAGIIPHRIVPRTCLPMLATCEPWYSAELWSLHPSITVPYLYV